MNRNEASVARYGDSERVKRLETFLSAFFGEDEPIYIRAFKAKGAPDSPANRPTKSSISRANLRNDPTVFHSLCELNRERGVYFVVNAGGQTKTSISRPTALFAESDTLAKDEQHRLLDTAPLKTSIRVETARSIHAFWLLDGTCSVSEWEHFQLRLIGYLSGIGLSADTTIKDASRVMRLPGFDHLSYGKETREYERVPVQLVEFNPERRYKLAAMMQAFAKSSNSLFETGLNSNELPEKILDGEGRTREMVSLAGTLNNRGLTSQEMLAMLRVVNEQRFVPPLSDEKLRSIVDSVSRYESANPLGGPAKQEPLTDFGNSTRLVQSYSDVLRYDLVQRLWIAWDGTRWVVESSDGLAMQFAFKVPNLIALEAAEAGDEGNKKALLKHAISTQSARALEAIVRLAKHRREIAANVEDFDPHNHLLNVANGTIDLRTGEIREYSKEDKITKLVPIAYDAAASAPLFDKFLTRIFDGNQSLICFMQRVCGYTLTGETGEQCLFLLHGDGANGKSTFLEVIAALTAEYGMHVRTEALMKHKNTSAGGASEDIAELRGSRFVSAVETNVGQQLAEGLLKQVTGQDRVKARKLYGHNIEFRPTFKLWLACNHKPEIAGTDHAIWRRIHLIPFDVTIPENEREKRILDKLKAELPGILAWGVRGAVEYYREGLKVPDEVKRATERYQSEQDTLSDFIADTCEVDPNSSAPVSEVYMMFDMWCRANGEAVMHRKLFSQMMRARGFKQAQAQRGRVWRGLSRRAFSGAPKAEGGATPETAKPHNSSIASLK